MKSLPDLVRQTAKKQIRDSEFSFTTLEKLYKTVKKKYKTVLRKEFLVMSLLKKDAGFILTATMIYHKDKAE